MEVFSNWQDRIEGADSRSVSLHTYATSRANLSTRKIKKNIPNLASNQIQNRFWKYVRTEKLIECAFFNPEAIIGKSTKYNLASDAAHKFERGVDINAQENTLRRFIHIVSEHTRIFKLNLKTFDYSKKQDLILNIDEQKINSILGTSLSRVDYVNYLSKLGFITDNKIKVPSYRTDIANQNDIAEEVARIIGFNNIPSKPINFLNKKNINKASNTLKLKSLLVNNGFSEVINYPFSSAESDRKSVV